MAEKETPKKSVSVKPKLNITKKKTAAPTAAAEAKTVVVEVDQPKATDKPKATAVKEKTMTAAAATVKEMEREKTMTMAAAETKKTLLPPPNSKAATNLKQRADRTMHQLLKNYLDNITKDSPTEELELEVKFGTMGIKSITRINYDNIIIGEYSSYCGILFDNIF